MKFIHVNTDTGEIRVKKHAETNSVWTIFSVPDNFILSIPVEEMTDVVYVFEHLFKTIPNWICHISTQTEPYYE